jgi:hypothetical protein
MTRAYGLLVSMGNRRWIGWALTGLLIALVIMAVAFGHPSPHGYACVQDGGGRIVCGGQVAP